MCYVSKNSEIQRLIADPEVLEVLQMMKLSGHDERQTQRSEKVIIVVIKTIPPGTSHQHVDHS